MIFIADQNRTVENYPLDCVEPQIDADKFFAAELASARHGRLSLLG